ncbi:MAG: DUF692 family protein, partial [Deltaproteobacteria bacterium]|nr:DUF692 family protein [Deltaproteobacteria bacterium]
AVLRDDADYYEVAPETTWRLDGRGDLVENDYHGVFAELGRETGKPFVAHGVGLSLGTPCASDARRRRRWLRRIARDHAVFRYLWYTDHLGMSSADGHAISLPVAIPMTAGRAATVRRALSRMQRIVPRVGFETTAQHFVLGHALDEPAFIAECLEAPGTHLVLDLHNVVVMADNLGFDPRTYLDGLFAHGVGRRVIEIHVSGGHVSDPAWLPSRRVLRLDAHDHAVPELVWTLLAEVLPRCPRLLGVTLERMEGTVGESDVGVVRDELRRARAIVAENTGKRGRSPVRRRRPWGRPRPRARLDRRTEAWIESMLARLLLDADPVAALARARRADDTPDGARPMLDAIDADGLAMSALLVARLRFERVTNGSSRALRAFEADPARFAETFRRYHRDVPPRVFSVQEEGRAFDRFLGAQIEPAPTRRTEARTGRR